METKMLLKQALVAAIYVALVTVFAWVSYGDVQFRVAELLLLLVLFDKRYILGLGVGTFLSNLSSPLGAIDWVVGTLATLIALYLMIKTKKPLWLVLLWPAIINGILIGIELNIVFSLPLIMTMLLVFLGEFVVVTIGGSLLYPLLNQNQTFKRVVDLNA